MNVWLATACVLSFLMNAGVLFIAFTLKRGEQGCDGATGFTGPPGKDGIDGKDGKDA